MTRKRTKNKRQSNDASDTSEGSQAQTGTSQFQSTHSQQQAAQSQPQSSSQAQQPQLGQQFCRGRAQRRSEDTVQHRPAGRGRGFPPAQQQQQHPSRLPEATPQQAQQQQLGQGKDQISSGGRGELARFSGDFQNPTKGSSVIPLQQQQYLTQDQQRHSAHQQHSSQQRKQQGSAQQCPLGSSKAKVTDIEQTLQQLSLKKKSVIPPSEKLPILTVSSDLAKIQREKIPKRKDPNKAGTLGRRIFVKTNMMKINVDRIKANVVHYDVDIVPNTPKYLMRPVFLQAKLKLFPSRNPAFDGKKNAFSAGVLPIPNPATVDVIVYNEDGREKQYTVTIKEANRIDLSWLKSIGPGLQETERDQISLQALDVILRSAPSLTATSVGRSFFTPPKGGVVSLGGGMDLWVGLFQSAVLGWKPYLNIDVAHKAFPKQQNVLDLMKTICGCSSDQAEGGRQQYGRQQGYARNQQQGPAELTPDLIRRNKEDIKKFLKGLKVVIEIPGQPTTRRTQRVNDLVKCPRENTFECNGQRITVEQYYKLEKRYDIKFPNFPCLWVGNREKNIHVPPELCTIVAGQVVQRKLDENQTSSMIRHAATGTDERKKRIMDVFNSMRLNEDPCMTEFGISVSGEFETVPARVLDPPTLKYENKSTARVAKGVWRVGRFEKPSQLIKENGSWTILNLNFRTRQDEIYKLVDALKRTGSAVGMPIGDPLTPFKSMRLRENDIRELMDYFSGYKAKNINLVIVIIPELKGNYSKVKQISELRVGVLTSCLKGKTLMKVNDASTMNNILLKINAKLNGVNHVFDLNSRLSRPACLTRPCMIVGADVTHPSPDAMDIPSIAAVAASHDPNAFEYNVEIRLQPPRQEIIGELAEIMLIHLKYFYKKTGGLKPDKIIFFRDGVSEGQFGQIMHVELLAIRKACQSLPGDYKPPITFLVVQKRHHVRLFPTDARNSDDRNKNVQAGTIVDTNITHPSDIDFYLVSHASIQGTARPTKYRCLWDDSDMSENEIELLTYFLCHMFARCTRSVSYPAPTYYAHLAAFRARALTQDVDIDMRNLPAEQLKKLTVKEEVLKGNPMFFV